MSEIGRRSLFAGGLAAVTATAITAPANADTAAPNTTAPNTTAPTERLQGYSLPLSPKGTANLVPAPPWHYVGDAVGVEFWTTPEAAEASLPTGLSPDPKNPGHGFAVFIDWQTSGEHQEYLDPVRSQYSEFLILLDAQYQTTPVAWCPYIWVDNDAALARGWFQGFPKKMGQINQTRAFGIASKAAPVVGPGGTYGAAMSTGGRRLAEAKLTLQQTSPNLPALTRPIVNLRHFPTLKAGQYNNPAVHELTLSVLDNLVVGNNWVGSGDLSFFPAPGDELADLRIVRCGVGFKGSLSYTVTDLRILTGPNAG